MTETTKNETAEWPIGPRERAWLDVADAYERIEALWISANLVSLDAAKRACRDHARGGAQVTAVALSAMPCCT